MSRTVEKVPSGGLQGRCKEKEEKNLVRPICGIGEGNIAQEYQKKKVSQLGTKKNFLKDLSMGGGRKRKTKMEFPLSVNGVKLGKRKNRENREKRGNRDPG